MTWMHEARTSMAIVGCDGLVADQQRIEIEQLAREELSGLAKRADERVRGELRLDRWPLHT